MGERTSRNGSDVETSPRVAVNGVASLASCTGVHLGRPGHLCLLACLQCGRSVRREPREN